jgi:hypothetical protein
MKLSVIYDKLTNVVVAACTRSAATPNGGDLALLAGDAIPVLDDKALTVGALPVKDLALLDSEIADPDTATGPLFAPTTYVVSTSPASVVAGNSPPSLANFDASSFKVTLTNPNQGKARLRITSLQTGEVAFFSDADVTAATTTLAFSIAPHLAPGGYGCVLFVTGMAALIMQQTV